MSDTDSLMSAITWVAVALGIGVVISIGVIVYCCCFGVDDEQVDQATLLDGLLRRDQLELTTLENGEDAGWQCVVCAYSNLQSRKACLMCGTSVGFLMTNRLVRLKSSGMLLGNEEPNLLEEDQRARQRALFKRRMNSMSLRKDLSQRQRGAIRRRLWERKLDSDGKFHWVRQNSTDNFNDTPLSGNSILLPSRGKVQQVNGPLESVADYHNLRSQGFVWQYDDLGRLTWKQAEDGASFVRCVYSLL